MYEVHVFLRGTQIEISLRPSVLNDSQLKDLIRFNQQHNDMYDVQIYLLEDDE